MRMGIYIADSGEGCVNRADVINGIQSVKENDLSALIEDQTQPL